MSSTSSNVTVTGPYPLTVDYGMPIEVMAAVIGFTGYIDKRFNSANFPYPHTGTQDFVAELVQFDAYASLEQQRVALAARGLSEAPASVLFTLAGSYPTLYRELSTEWPFSFTVVATGSIVPTIWDAYIDNELCVTESGFGAVLTVDDNGSGMIVPTNVGEPWHQHCRFLAVRIKG
jgi:hypothetical protein